MFHILKIERRGEGQPLYPNQEETKAKREKLLKALKKVDVQSLLS